MKKFIFWFLVLPFFVFGQVNVLKDTASIRAILVDKNKIWFAGSNAKVGFYDLETQQTQHIFTSENKKTEFRSIAQNKESVFVLSVGNPALLYEIDKITFKSNLVYTENNEKVFYDSMVFANENFGMAMGDPITDCLSVIFTDNKGKSWQKLDCNNLPKTASGEAAFAASNTNLVIKNKTIWMVSGGKKSRVFKSTDLGKTWNTFETPIIQGLETQGAYSMDFYDQNNGFLVGGDYTKSNNSFKNKAKTSNGGKTWELVSDGNGFGYSSCVQYTPFSKGKKSLAIASEGVYKSDDSGKTWKLLINEKNLNTLKFITPQKIVVAGNNKMMIFDIQ
jgi:photosystem II stability/assembly factor-like uncharacterized protein